MSKPKALFSFASLTSCIFAYKEISGISMYYSFFEFKVLPNFLVECIKYIISPVTDNRTSISAKAGEQIPNRHGHGQQVSFDLRGIF
jgi:hypothetical protein